MSETSTKPQTALQRRIAAAKLRRDAAVAAPMSWPDGLDDAPEYGAPKPPAEASQPPSSNTGVVFQQDAEKPRKNPAEGEAENLDFSYKKNDKQEEEKSAKQEERADRRADYRTGNQGENGSRQPVNPDLLEMLERFKFDWFQFTIPTRNGLPTFPKDSPEERLALKKAVGWADQAGLHQSRKFGSGSNGYRSSIPLLNGSDGEKVGSIMHKSSAGTMPNVILTGGNGVCHHLAKHAQNFFSDLRLSRADCALDLSAEGLFDRLLEMANRFSRGNSKLGKVRTIFAEGRTFYLGSPSSTVSLRVYEKGFEQVQKGLVKPEDLDRNWVRIEWTFRPQSKKKKDFSRLSPAEMIRTSVWAREFMRQAGAIACGGVRMRKLEPVKVASVEVPKSLERSADHGVKQYGMTFVRLAAAQLIRERGLSYAHAVLKREEIEARALEIFAARLRDGDAAARIISEEGLQERLTAGERINEIVDFAESDEAHRASQTAEGHDDATDALLAVCPSPDEAQDMAEAAADRLDVAAMRRAIAAAFPQGGYVQ